MLGKTTILHCLIPLTLKNRLDVRQKKGMHVLRIKVKKKTCFICNSYVKQKAYFCCVFRGHANMKAFVDHISTYEVQFAFSFVCRLLCNSVNI
jgi:hypothetical protein